MHVVKITISPMPVLDPLCHLAMTLVCDRQIHNITSYIRNMLVNAARSASSY